MHAPARFAPRLDLTRHWYVVAVAEGSSSRAAARVSVAQPVSVQIRRLVGPPKDLGIARRRAPL
jgi:hypothetical protein